MDTNNLEQTLQEAKLYRYLNSLIVAHLRDNNLTQAASAVASATMTPLNIEASPNKLLELVAKGLAAEKDENGRGVTASTLFDSSTAIPTTHGSIPAPRPISVDFSAAHDIEGSSKRVLKQETRRISEHKVGKIKQTLLPKGKDGGNGGNGGGGNDPNALGLALQPNDAGGQGFGERSYQFDYQGPSYHSHTRGQDFRERSYQFDYQGPPYHSHIFPYHDHYYKGEQYQGAPFPSILDFMAVLYETRELAKETQKRNKETQQMNKETQKMNKETQQMIRRSSDLTERVYKESRETRRMVGDLHNHLIPNA